MATWPDACNSLWRGNKNLTSSFRPPGGPTPTRGFFYLLEPPYGPDAPASRWRFRFRFLLGLSGGSTRPALLIPSPPVRVLAGDIGGTKTAVAIYEIGPRRLVQERTRRYPSVLYGSLEEILEDFLSGERRVPRFAGFGVAGPVVSGRAKITKLPWTIDAGGRTPKDRWG
jgi:hypothetical protein